MQREEEEIFRPRTFLIYVLSIQQNMTEIIIEIRDVQWAIIYDLEDTHNEAWYSEGSCKWITCPDFCDASDSAFADWCNEIDI